MTAKIGDVGTLRELDVKPGDRVMHGDGSIYEIRMHDGEPSNWDVNCGYWGVTVSESVQDYTLISRATPEHTIWRDLSPEEKGALLLAAHDGKAIELWDDIDHEWLTCRYPNWKPGCVYRLTREPVRETVKIYGSGGYWTRDISPKQSDTHRITFDTIDGVPDCTSVKMEAI